MSLPAGRQADPFSMVGKPLPTSLDQGLPRHHLAALLACRGLGLAETGKRFRRGRPGTRNLAVTRADTRDGDAMPRDVPGAALSARRPITSANAGGLMGCGKTTKAAATVPAPHSYPHVTCGWGHRPAPMFLQQPVGDGSFTLAGSANGPGSRTGRGRACPVPGPGGRTVPAAGRTGPTRPFRSGWVWCSPTCR